MNSRCGIEQFSCVPYLCNEQSCGIEQFSCVPYLCNEQSCGIEQFSCVPYLCNACKNYFLGHKSTLQCALFPVSDLSHKKDG